VQTVEWRQGAPSGALFLWVIVPVFSVTSLENQTSYPRPAVVRTRRRSIIDVRQTTVLFPRSKRRPRRLLPRIVQMLEASLGKLAEQKAENSAVKQFGQRMDTDHNKIQNDWVNMATKNGLTVRPAMGPHHRANLSQVAEAFGNGF
jgi:predicted outer membrane protein